MCLWLKLWARGEAAPEHQSGRSEITALPSVLKNFSPFCPVRFRFFSGSSQVLLGFFSGPVDATTESRVWISFRTRLKPPSSLLAFFGRLLGWLELLGWMWDHLGLFLTPMPYMATGAGRVWTAAVCFGPLCSDGRHLPPGGAEPGGRRSLPPPGVPLGRVSGFLQDFHHPLGIDVWLRSGSVPAEIQPLR